jgi:hypothetical protein
VILSWRDNHANNANFNVSSADRPRDPDVHLRPYQFRKRKECKSPKFTFFIEIIGGVGTSNSFIFEHRHADVANLPGLVFHEDWKQKLNHGYLDCH